jgi:hypothetical protein
VRKARAAGAAAVTRVEAAAPGKYWSQLSAVDFMNSSLAFAALAVLVRVPLSRRGPRSGRTGRQASNHHPYFLLYRRVGWRQLLPAGVATGFCITGLGVFSALLFSDRITSSDASYGPAGVVVAIISYLVGYGVCLHLGAVFGRMWNDWRSTKRLRSPPMKITD